MECEAGRGKSGWPGRGTDASAHVEGVEAGTGEDVLRRGRTRLHSMAVSHDGREGEALGQDALVRVNQAFLQPRGMGMFEVVQVTVIVRRCQDAQKLGARR